MSNTYGFIPNREKVEVKKETVTKPKKVTTTKNNTNKK